MIVESVALMGWWLYQARGESFGATWTLFSSFNIGSVLIQSAIVIGVLLLLNGWLAGKLSGTAARAGMEGAPGSGTADHGGADFDSV